MPRSRIGVNPERVLSSVGRAAPLQGVGREFEPLSTHHFRFATRVRRSSKKRCNSKKAVAVTETRMAICLAGFLSFRGRRACNAPAAWIECVARRRRAVERGVRRVTASHDLLRFLPCIPPMHPGCLPVGGGSHASSMMPGGGRRPSPSRANGVFVRRARRR